MRNRRNSLWRTLGLIIFALGVFIMLTALQRQLIYFPSKAPADALLELASRLDLRVWRDNEGKAIGWKPAARPLARYRMLVFHGNAGYALDRHYFLAGWRSLGDDWEVFLFEYPGYGAREGTPSEENFKTAAANALELMLAEDSRPVYITGESLGTGIASFLAATFPNRVAGLLLVTPFSSLVDVASHHFPFLPMRILLTERYDSREALSRYRGPVAFLLAGQDEVVTTESGLQLYHSYSGPKWLHVETDAGHNTLNYNPGARWWGDVAAFLTSSNRN